MSTVLTVKEAAQKMGFCTNTVISLFQNEPGVIVKVSPTIDRPGKYKRRYRSFRIPQHVFDRVVGRMAK